MAGVKPVRRDGATGRCDGTVAGWIVLVRGADVLAHEVAHVDETHALDEVRRSSVFAEVRNEVGITVGIADRPGEIGTGLLFMA